MRIRDFGDGIMSNAYKAIRQILTLRCEEADRLMSDSLDRRLTWSERVALKGHVAVCRGCRRARQQLLILRQTIRKSLEIASAAGDEMLSPEARDRIRQALKDSG